MAQPRHSVPQPFATISRRAAQRLAAGHVWVYRSDLVNPPKAAPGALVEVRDERGKTLGTALYSSASQIALRLLAKHPLADEAQLHDLVRRRLDAALQYRQRLVRDADAYRVVFSEADALPGLIVDRYHDIVSFQVLTQGFDPPQRRQVVLEWIRQSLAPRAIVERVDARIRDLEQLPQSSGGVVSVARAPAQPSSATNSTEAQEPSHASVEDGIAAEASADEGARATQTVFTINGLRFHYDASSGQKTGAFLDQRENYAAAERYARGEALDVFCYQGGFALHLARACERVTAIDSSRPALEVAEQNETLNPAGRRAPEVEWIEANAFDLLKDYASAGRQYDTIVLDPPAFAKSARNLETALRGYKELNLRALKMLRPGGVLVTCSCSYHVGESAFVEMLGSAAQDAHRTVRVLERRGAALDHPAVLTIPETHYLKCVVVNVTGW